MRFNGIELTTVHPKISVNKEIPPGMPAREVITATGTDGEIVCGVITKADEYIVRVNIACRTREEAWKVRGLLARWASSSGNQTAQLEPTMLPGKAYDAIVKSIDAPEFVFGFATVDVTFLLPRPLLHDLARSTASGTGTETILRISGDAPCRPVIRQTLAASSEEGWTLSLDGKTALRILGSVSAGDVIEADFARGLVIIGGENALARLDWQSANWHPGFAPGRRTVTTTDAGAVSVAWRNEWM